MTEPISGIGVGERSDLEVTLSRAHLGQLFAVESARQEAIGVYQKHGASEELARAFAVSFPIGYEPKDGYAARRSRANNAGDFMLLAYDIITNGKPSDSQLIPQACSYIDTAVRLDEISMRADALASARATILSNLNDTVKVLRASREDINRISLKYAPRQE